MRLDDLLDATGISDLESEGLQKNAHEAPATEEHEQFLKLAERCERAATQSGATQPVVRERELAEKTAAIAVIAQTLGEIEAMVGGTEKVAADRSPAAAFIELALAEGHAPAEIARFMKQAGMLSRAANNLLGRAGIGAGEALHGFGARHVSSALREAAEDLGPAPLGRYIDKLRANYGDRRVRQLIERSGAKLDHVPSVRDLLPQKPPKYGVTTDQLKQVAKPAAGVAAGLAAGKALFGDGGDDKRHGGVTVVRS
jgi:hypothetical protein